MFQLSLGVLLGTLQSAESYQADMTRYDREKGVSPKLETPAPAAGGR